MLGKRDSLSLRDMANMAIISANMRYMDSSVEFLRGLQKFGMENTFEMELIQDFVKKLNKQIISIHNKMLQKGKKIVGIDFRGKNLRFRNVMKYKFPKSSVAKYKVTENLLIMASLRNVQWVFFFIKLREMKFPLR